MAMAELFFQSGFELAFAHCNFKLRGHESDADEAFVKKVAKKHGVECFTRSFDTAKIAEESGDSIQMAARNLRYAFFDEIAEEHGFDRIATAHHLDDQIETFFINLSRGCGIAGLHGIPLKKDKLIRPLMFAYRKDIEHFISERDILFREDSSNMSVKYQRNKIRHELLPVFLEMNPSFREEMSGNIRRLAATEEVYKQVVELAKREVLASNGNEITLDILKLKLFSPLAQILYELISEFGFRQADVENIIRSMEGISGKKFLSRTHQLIIDRKKILITTLSGDIKDEVILIYPDTDAIENPVRLLFKTEAGEQYSIPADKNIASLDFEKLSFPLQLRRWQRGDAFVPLGMNNRKKLSDFFIDEKFSILEKEKTYVLCSGKDIIWIVGHRIDERYKITESTKEVYFVQHPAASIRHPSLS